MSKLSPLVRDFTETTIQHFSEFDWIRSLPLVSELGEFEICHTLEGRYIFSDSDVQLQRSTIIGHSHQQFIRDLPNAKLVNPGSLGQNRKSIDVMEYMIYDYSFHRFEVFSVKYDFEKLLQKMKNLRYTQKCIDYYVAKKLSS